MARRKISLVKPEIVEIVLWDGEKWVRSSDNSESTFNIVTHFEIVDEVNPDLIHYICKYGYKITEENGQIKVLRIGFIEYEQESANYMA